MAGLRDDVPTIERRVNLVVTDAVDPDAGSPDAEPPPHGRARSDGRAGCPGRSPDPRPLEESPRTRKRASRYHPADAAARRRPCRRTPPRRFRACRVSRVLGIDLGSRRIGIAVADAGVGIARPLVTVNRGRSIDDDAAAIGRLCREQGVAELVVGLPIEAAGQEGTMAAGRARLGDGALGERLGLPVTMRDERLSSFEAERRLGPMPRGRSGGAPTKTQRDAYRAQIDREAASVILQDELDARRGPAGVAPALAPVLPSRGAAVGDPEETR